MNQADFEKHIGKSIRIGIPNYFSKEKVFNVDGILIKADSDGILVSKNGKENFLRYSRILTYHIPSGSGTSGN